MHTPGSHIRAHDGAHSGPDDEPLGDEEGRAGTDFDLLPWSKGRTAFAVSAEALAEGPVQVGAALGRYVGMLWMGGEQA